MRIYIKPVTDVTMLNLVGSVLQTLPVADPSYRAPGEGLGNTFDFDEEEEDMLPTQKSLWE